MPSLSVNWVCVLPVVIDAISQAPHIHMPVPAVWRQQPIYILQERREHVLADKQIKPTIGLMERSWENENLNEAFK